VFRPPALLPDGARSMFEPSYWAGRRLPSSRLFSRLRVTLLLSLSESQLPRRALACFFFGFVWFWFVRVPTTLAPRTPIALVPAACLHATRLQPPFSLRFLVDPLCFELAAGASNGRRHARTLWGLCFSLALLFFSLYPFLPRWGATSLRLTS